jgi:hypothetical protein
MCIYSYMYLFILVNKFILKYQKLCKKNDLFYQSICHPLRLLRIHHVPILGDLPCLKGYLFLLLDCCIAPMPAKLCALTHSLNLSANGKRLWTFDLDKSQVRGRYNCIRDIRKSHCQPFCAHRSAQQEWAHACTLLIKKKKTALWRFSLSLVCLCSAPESL